MFSYNSNLEEIIMKIMKFMVKSIRSAILSQRDKPEPFTPKLNQTNTVIICYIPLQSKD